MQRARARLVRAFGPSKIAFLALALVNGAPLRSSPFAPFSRMSTPIHEIDICSLLTRGVSPLSRAERREIRARVSSRSP
jgi:hypothetical protein